MKFTHKIKSFLIFLAFLSMFSQISCFAQGQINYQEFDNLRAELNILKDKNSPNYIKTKKKLEKFILQNKINYSSDARFDDISRLVSEQKFQSALYELFDLIDLNIEPSRCYEILGDIYLKKQNKSEASKYYKISKQYDQDNVSSMFKHTKLYLAAQKNILAIELLKDIALKTSDNAFLSEIERIINEEIKPQNRFEANNLYEVLAIIYTKQGDIDKTYFALDRALSLNVDDVFLKYWLGDLFLKNKDNKNALLVYNSILKDIPYDTQIRNSKAKAFVAQGNLASAKKEYLTVLEQYPNSKQAKYGIFKIYQYKLMPNEILGKIYPQKKNFKPNKADYLTFASFLEEMDDIEGANMFKKCAFELEKQAQIAQSKKNNFKQIAPKETKTEVKKVPFVKKQQIAQEKKLQEKVEQKELSQEKPIALKNGYQKYQKTLDNYFKINPKTPDIYIAIANTYKLAGERDLAIKYFEEAKKMNPTNPDIYYHLGLVYLEKNDAQKAKAFLEKSLNLDKENLKAKNLLAFVDQKIVTEKINLAYAKYEKKEYIDGLNILDKTIKQYPKNSQLYYYRALIYIAMNRNAAAIIDLQKAVELDYGNYMAYYQLGKTYEKIKDEKSALVFYERFLSMEPDEKDLADEIQKKVLLLGEKYY